VDGRPRSRLAGLHRGRSLLAVAQDRRRTEKDERPAAVAQTAAETAFSIEVVGGLHPLIERLRELVARFGGVGVAAAPERLHEVDRVARGVQVIGAAALVWQHQPAGGPFGQPAGAGQRRPVGPRAARQDEPRQQGQHGPSRRARAPGHLSECCRLRPAPALPGSLRRSARTAPDWRRAPG